MSKQEKVIVVIAVLVIIFGIYSFFIASPDKRTRIETGKNITKLNKLVNDVAAELKEGALTEAEEYIIAQAGTEWTKSPFFEGRPSWKPGIGGISAQAEKVEFMYTGYVELGKKRLAVINGLDYQIGEIIVNKSPAGESPAGEHIVQGIYPDRVILKPGGKQKAITVKFINEEW